MFVKKSSVSSVGIIRRCLSTQRPPFYEVFPKKSIMNRVLFDLDSRHSYRKLYTVYENVYKTLDNDEEPVIPKFVDASDLMIMKKSLEAIRTRSHATNKHLLQLENELTEKAAEHGNNDAVSLLAYEAFMDKDAPKDDKEYAKELITKLLDMKHPLTTKLSADTCIQNGMVEEGEHLYLEFLKLENDTFLASEVYKGLGMLYFQRADLTKSKLYFEQSVKTGPLDKLAEVHYYLGQLTTNDADRSKYHLEISASQGFLQSFPLLGFLELNYFQNLTKAREWFKLGSEMGDVQCVIGLFDCFIKLDDLKIASRLYLNLRESLSNSKDQEAQTVWKHFIESRGDSINKVKDLVYSNETVTGNIVKDTLSSQLNKKTTDKNNRWGI
ncbi:hypothetical protein BN7_839 [Wickerhamomyces ciferrii]|uniref:Uncharacterized protein n=1 Tax=Wickerhamomyces ciferrii (strain ATCC 14091 / BCRC 22168 / CBS 111 / JCM 3599 / NBRC 0793 / NRRL Y-1031 F-60-10) TaxID=1206466 RepID=K0KGJ7_WICCF|nr:uncharacterized protein BN7_839 [Wickerhamomyces ciferrii]CCH41302.1 hypothetical protein BN7_839 [Wickerhamomyces ciferrii]